MNTTDRGIVKVNKVLLAYARAAAKEDGIDVNTFVEQAIQKALSRRTMQRIRESCARLEELEE